MHRIVKDLAEAKSLRRALVPFFRRVNLAFCATTLGRMRFNNGVIWRCVALLAAVYFILRGPWRAIHDSGDFLTVFAAARCWIHDMNPYAVGDLVVSARSAGAHVSEAHFLGRPSVYLPPALLLLSPLAALPWAFAKAIWLCVSLGASLWAVMALARMAQRWTVAVSAFLLAFAPLHTGIKEGQPSVLVCALIVISIVTPQPYIAGLLLGIAVCIKPQLALSFCFLALARNQGRKLIAACTTGLVLSGVALMCMKQGSLATLIQNLSVVGSASGMNSGSALNLFRYLLINVDTLIPQALYSTPVVGIVYAIIVLVSAIAVVRAMDIEVGVAVVASAAVLVGYHRFYDAQILLLGIPVALSSVAQGRMSLVLWAGYSVFLIPGQAMAATLFGSGKATYWSFLLLHHQTLACVVIWLIFTRSAIATAKSPAADSEALREMSCHE